MTIHFSKYQGAGNDFILIDNRSRTFPFSIKLINQLCDRKFGIGSDGLMLIEEHPEYDYLMRFYNPDGSESLCGNGSRCGFQFARTLRMASDEAKFETTDGVHKAELLENAQVRFSLRDVATIEKTKAGSYVNTGSPHVVCLVPDVSAVDVVAEGRQIRYSEEFVRQNGTNVNFAQLLQDRIKVRTYERGVEAETLSCGTGVTAVGLVSSGFQFNSPVTIETAGGTLTVEYEKTSEGFRNIWLSGPATHVFDGSIKIDDSHTTF